MPDKYSEQDGTEKKGQGSEESTPMPLKNLGGAGGAEPASPIDMIGDVSLNVRIELGRSKMAIEDILKLQAGSVVTLDKLAGDYVDVLVNDRLVARGEVLVLNDNFCVRIAEIISPEDRLGQTS
jgi:flagellar motor switch protein FliN